MRIPLDYYRILGLPIQATDEQRAMAYRDRLLQLPRREYSDVAIAARKQLIDEAYTVLSDPEQRDKYNAAFLAKTRPEQEELSEDIPEADDEFTPSIEIRNEQFIGALVILYELGEYELVLKLGQPYLLDKESELERGELGDRDLVRSDIVLTLALTCLELGREQWQQGNYEGASTSLETGQALLLKEGLFPSVRGELQSDGYKLRPYRVLYLLAQSEDQVTQRRLGLRLLQEMLQERNGIDGAGEDQSGLNVDDFLRFVQQLRIYLTCTEQQLLFEQEAKRPSAVATYLSVYALIARGFAQRKPDLILRGKQILNRLGKRQDVHLETAICSLLLGQTEAASRALENSQEYEPLAFIREHSEDSPDLLPGLCLYAERWLQKSVFPHFRDLNDQKVSLKDYFADTQVQAFLESLPADAELTREWTVIEQTTLNPNHSKTERRTSLPPINGRPVAKQTIAPPSLPVTTPATTAVKTAPTPSFNLKSTESVPLAERVVTAPQIVMRSPAAVANRPEPQLSPPPQPTPLKRRVRRQPNQQEKLLRLIIVGAGSLLVLWLLFSLIAGAIGMLQRSLQGSSQTSVDTEQPLVSINQPPVAIPVTQPSPAVAAPASPATPTNPTINEAKGREIIDTWLKIKARALGENYEADQLNNILTDSALARWQRTVQDNRAETTYWKYNHKIGQVTIKPSDQPNQGAIEAQVQEEAQFYQNGRLNQPQSYNDNLLVRYEVIRKENQWRIRDMRILR